MTTRLPHALHTALLFVVALPNALAQPGAPAAAQARAPDSRLTAAPTPANAGAKLCKVGPPQTIATRSSKRLYALEFFADRQGALLAWSETPDETQVVPLSVTGERHGEIQSLKLAAARRLSEIRRWDDAHYLISTHGVCDPAIRDHKCLVAQLLDQTGAPVGSSTRHDTNEWMTTDGIEQVGQKLYILYHTEYISPSLILLAPDAQGALRFQNQAKHGFGACTGELGGMPGEFYNMKLVADQDGWIVLRPTVQEDGPHGNIQNGQSGALCTADKIQEIKGFPKNVAIEGFRRQDGELVALLVPQREDGETEQHKPSMILRIDTKGKLKGAPRPVKPNQPLPPPFGGSDTISWSLRGVETGKGPLRLTRRSARGLPYGDTILATLVEGYNDGPFAAGGWAGDHFLVATAAREKNAWQLVARSVDCSP